MWLEGIETRTFELAGALREQATDAIARGLSHRLALERDAARWGRFSLVVLEMKRLRPDVPVPLPGADYREVLYRVGATFDGAPAWLVLRCDIDRALVRRLARRVIRYPVAAARITVTEDDRNAHIEISTEGGRLAVTTVALESRHAPSAEAARRTFVREDKTLYEIPWQERPAPTRAYADVSDVDLAACASVFGAAVDVDARAVVHRGRVHRCGAARRVA